MNGTAHIMGEMHQMKIKTTIAAETTAEKQIGTTTEIHPVTITTTTEITTGVVEIT